MWGHPSPKSKTNCAAAFSPKKKFSCRQPNFYKFFFAHLTGYIELKPSYFFLPAAPTRAAPSGARVSPAALFCASAPGRLQLCCVALEYCTVRWYYLYNVGCGTGGRQVTGYDTPSPRDDVFFGSRHSPNLLLPLPPRCPQLHRLPRCRQYHIGKRGIR